jgi:hypothetical protein
MAIIMCYPSCFGVNSCAHLIPLGFILAGVCIRLRWAVVLVLPPFHCEYCAHIFKSLSFSDNDKQLIIKYKCVKSCKKMLHEHVSKFCTKSSALHKSCLLLITEGKYENLMLYRMNLM